SMNVQKKVGMKLLSGFLAAAMVVTMIPTQILSAFAAESSTMTNIALNCPYEKSAEPLSAYPDSGNLELTDGAIGREFYSDGQWIGYLSNDPIDFIIDLGATKSFSGVEVVALRNTGGGVVYPASLSFSYSTDKTSWSPLIDDVFPDETLPAAVHTYSYTHPMEVSGRYVKLSLPSGWAFISEIRVLANSGGEVVAAEKPTFTMDLENSQCRRKCFFYGKCSGFGRWNSNLSVVQKQ
ncbi:MAG: discoidin domain-containing protein, partial [Oscillospiraceae bacterium]